MTVDDQVSMLARLIEQLPPDARKVIELRHGNGLSLEKIADELGQSPAVVADQLMTTASLLNNSLTNESSTLPPVATDADTLPMPSPVDARATETLVDYLQRVDGGETLDPEQVLGPADERAEQLEVYFRLSDLMDRAAARGRETWPSARLDAAAAETRTPTETLDAAPGQRWPAGTTRSFGDYDLIGEIAKGAMGVVYKARQRKLNRIVALKMIRSGQMAGQEEIDRFYVEAEAAAGLRHPNIVSIYDVGEYDGQHYFSMDYIDGKSLAQLAADQPLPSRRAADFLKTIAAAVHYAHQNGILHRDLKPANVMLDKDERLLVTDFGLAKQTERSSGMTISGAIIGTPSYMSPEQAQGYHEQIGPGSDVYSLGAMLYDLLTGRPPFRAATALETVRQVIDSEVVPPRVIDASIPRDLDTICLKCLQKEPATRYASAQNLADELGRYLRDEPILARPISPATRLLRWCRRNPMIAASIGFAGVALLVALVASSLAAVVKSRALTDVQQAQERDRESYRQARQAVDDLFTEVSEHTLLNQPGLQSLRRDLLEKTLAYYQRFLDQRRNDPQLRDELAATHYRVGLITEAIGSPAEALAALRRAHALQTQLGNETPTEPRRRYALSNTANAIGSVLLRTHDLDGAQAAFQEAHGIRGQLVKGDPKNPEYVRKLANTMMNLGLVDKERHRLDQSRRQVAEAQSLRTKALRVEPENEKLQRDLAMGYYNLANVALHAQEQFAATGDPQADQQLELAIVNLRKAIALFEVLFEKDPNNFATQNQLATCYHLLADLRNYTAHQDQAHRHEAIQLYDQARPVFEALARMNPDVAKYQSRLAGLYLSEGSLFGAEGDLDRALAACDSARVLLTKLAEQYEEVPHYQRDLAMSLRSIAKVQARKNNWAAAGESLEAARVSLETLVKRYPDDPQYPQLLEQTVADRTQLDALEKASQSDRK